ncbi:MAG: hypothetical protein GY952_04865 [Rhodobacteraceae bacterium]|nr:hypothetical protein [Paracoccaceae bacterium]
MKQSAEAGKPALWVPGQAGLISLWPLAGEPTTPGASKPAQTGLSGH